MKKRVFRVVGADEFKILKNGDYELAGFCRETIPQLNNFQYEGEQKYIHFFDEKVDAICYHNAVLKHFHGNREYFLLEFVVSGDLLKKASGFGNYSFKKDVCEYAIKSCDLNPKNIKLIGEKRMEGNQSLFC